MRRSCSRDGPPPISPAKLSGPGAPADPAGPDPDRAATKFAALAATRVLQGRKTDAIAAASQALAHSQAVKIRFLTARALVAAGAADKARPIAVALAA